MSKNKFRALFENQVTEIRTWFYISVGNAADPKWGARVTDWQQFTGLCDKHGQEIYEGDILRPSVVNRKSLYEVRWNQGSASFHLKPIGRKEGGYSLYRNGEGYSPYEVIGNIYENPELLNVA